MASITKDILTSTFYKVEVTYRREGKSVVSSIDPLNWISSVADRLERAKNGHKVSELSVRWFADGGEAFTPPPGLLERFRRWVVRTFFKTSVTVAIGSLHFQLKKWDSRSNMAAVQSAFYQALKEGIPKVKEDEEKTKLSRALLFGLKSDEISSGASHEAICHDLLFQCIANKRASHSFRCTSPGETFIQYTQELEKNCTSNAFLNLCNALALVKDEKTIKEQKEKIEWNVNGLLCNLLFQAPSLEDLLSFMAQVLPAMKSASLSLSEGPKEALLTQLATLAKTTANHSDFQALCTLFQEIELNQSQQARVAAAAGTILQAEIREARAIKGLISPATGLHEMGALPVEKLSGTIFDAIIAQAKTVDPSLTEFLDLKTLFNTLTPYLSPKQRRSFTRLSLERVAKAAHNPSSRVFLEQCQTSIGHFLSETPKEKEKALPFEAQDVAPIAKGLATVWRAECQELVKKEIAVLSGNGIGKDEDIRGISEVLTKQFRAVQDLSHEVGHQFPKAIQKGVNDQMLEAIGAGFLPIGTKLLVDLQDKTQTEVDRLTAHRTVNKGNIKDAIRILEKLRVSLVDASPMISVHTDAEKKRKQCVDKIDALIEQLKRKDEKATFAEPLPKPLPEPALVAAPLVEVLKEATAEAETQKVQETEVVAAAQEERIVEQDQQMVQLSLARRVYHAVAPSLQILAFAGLQAYLTGGGLVVAADLATSYFFMSSISETIGRIAVPLFSRALQAAGMSPSRSTKVAQAATSLGMLFGFRRGLARLGLSQETTLLADAATGIKSVATQHLAEKFKGEAQETIGKHLDEGLLADVANDMAGVVCTAMTGAAVGQVEELGKEILRQMQTTAPAAPQKSKPAVHKPLTPPEESIAKKVAAAAKEAGRLPEAKPEPIGPVQDLTYAATPVQAVTPYQTAAVQQLLDMYQRTVAATPVGEGTGITSTDLGQRYTESLRSGNIQPFLEWLQTNVAAQRMPTAALEQPGLADAAHQVLGMSVQQLRTVLSDPECKNPLGLSVSEAAVHLAFFAELVAVHAPMALYSFLSPLVGNLMQPYGEASTGILQQPEAGISPLLPEALQGPQIPHAVPPIVPLSS